MCKNAADDSSTRRQTPSRASAASKTLESRRTNTRQFQNFVFAQLRSVFHQGIRASPQIFEALLLQPAQNFFSLLRREFFQFPDDISCAHDENNTYEATRRKTDLLLRRSIIYHKPLLPDSRLRKSAASSVAVAVSICLLNDLFVSKVEQGESELRRRDI